LLLAGCPFSPGDPLGDFQWRPRLQLGGCCVRVTVQFVFLFWFDLVGLGAARETEPPFFFLAPRKWPRVD
jgi:hypothetical protein